MKAEPVTEAEDSSPFLLCRGSVSGCYRRLRRRKTRLGYQIPVAKSRTYFRAKWKDWAKSTVEKESMTEAKQGERIEAGKRVSKS